MHEKSVRGFKAFKAQRYHVRLKKSLSYSLLEADRLYGKSMDVIFPQDPTLGTDQLQLTES